MNWLDVIVLVVVGWRAFSGYRRGLVRQVFELVGLVAGLFLAVRYYYYLQLQLRVYVSLPAPVLAIFSFLSVLFAVMLVARLLGYICTSLLSFPGLGWVNALSGAVVGILIAVVTISFLLGILTIFKIPPVETALAGSIFAPYLEEMVPFVLAMVEEYIPWQPAVFFERGEPVPLDRMKL